MGRATPVLEALLLLGIALPLAIGLQAPSVWFVVPFVAIVLSRRPFEDYGLSFRNLGSLQFHLVVSAAIFGGYGLVFYLFTQAVLGLSFRPTLPSDFPRLIVEQLLIVGLSEEFFFRGYLQTQLNRYFGRPYRLFGAHWGVGLIVAAAVFGLCHLVLGDISRLQVVFFGLFAGWLRERTGSIAVPAAYHGFANILQNFLQQSVY